jgi:glutathione S-transferase
MPIKMYDLAGAEADRRFSPFCWRTKLALAHKQLEVETIPWRYADKAAIAFANWDKVPVIVDEGKAVVDSWTIATHLESAHPAKPSLFGGSAGLGLARFFNAWADTVLNPAIARIVVLDIVNHLAPQDKDYFRKTREERLGGKLEDVVKNRESRLPAFRQMLEPIRQTLADQPFLGGGTSLYPDYIVFGSLMWARCISPLRLLEPTDPVNAWSERLLDAFGGMSRNAPRYW